MKNAGPASARLGGARADFVAGLGRKVADLKKTFAKVRTEPGAANLPAREELRRKLHALATAAKLMKCDAMQRGIAEAIGVIDRTAIDEPLVDVDLVAIEQLIEDLPALAWGDGPARSSKVEEEKREEIKRQTPMFQVLVVGTGLIAEALLETDTGERPMFGAECTPDAQLAFELVRDKEPDLVVIDADVDAAAELVEALMDDPNTESTPIVVVGSFVEEKDSAKYVALGVAKTIWKPTSREGLRAACEAALVPPKSMRPKLVMLGEPTLEELGERLANEIKEAIVGRANGAIRGKRIPLGEGTEVLGAVWGAIARVREVVTSRTNGNVRFDAGPDGVMPIASLLDSDVPYDQRARGRLRTPATEVRLTGRRIVVADDDPAVVWFMADLLKTAGCTVHEAFDGKEALELCYRTSPDLVISDILMPNLDGFSLCRALRRDVALRDTPVILLSWKEDLLQRVRELGANAAGYVRKESDTRAIVARVREALRPRTRVEMRLAEDGDIRGRLDTISVRTLLEIVCATRPDARVSVRDATFLYEVEIRGGAPQRATRTSGDGTFMKGSRVLAAMLGVSAGRFTVATSAAAVEGELDGNLAAQLAKPLARSRAATMLLSGGEHMTKVTRVRVDDAALTEYLAATPEPARKIAKRIADGMPPRALVLEGACEASLLEDILCDLAARGLVVGVETVGGEDLLVKTMKRLLAHTDSRASLAPKSMTTSPPPACMDDKEEFCESPSPDALVHELAHSSPKPVLPFEMQSQSPAFVQPGTPRSPRSIVDEGTPSAEEILALGEATIVDDTTYGEEEDDEEEEEAAPDPSMSIPVDEASMAIADKTPFATVSSKEEESAAEVDANGVPKRKAWPMVAFVAASGVVAWAVLHFSAANQTPPKHVEVAPPPVVYEDPRDIIPPPPPAMPTTLVAPKVEEKSETVEKDAGVQETMHPKPVPTTSMLPEPRTEERGCTVDAHSSKVARVRL